MPRKHLKNLLAHTAGRIRYPKIEQFSAAGVPTGSGAAGNSSSQIQAVIGGVTSGSGSNVSGSNVSEQVATLSKYLNDLRLTQQTSIDTLTANTQALVQNTVIKSSGGSTTSTTGSLLSGLFGGTFGLSPILNGLISLFKGSAAPTLQPLAPFSLPPAIRYEGGYSATNGGQAGAANYGQSGAPRVSSPPPATNVQIQVNAMDSRSFLDHSADIANAVREAMLHSNSLNDVIADL